MLAGCAQDSLPTTPPVSPPSVTSPTGAPQPNLVLPLPIHAPVPVGLLVTSTGQWAELSQLTPPVDFAVQSLLVAVWGPTDQGNDVAIRNVATATPGASPELVLVMGGGECGVDHEPHQRVALAALNRTVKAVAWTYAVENRHCGDPGNWRPDYHLGKTESAFRLPAGALRDGNCVSAAGTPWYLSLSMRAAWNQTVAQTLELTVATPWGQQNATGSGVIEMRTTDVRGPITVALHRPVPEPDVALPDVTLAVTGEYVATSDPEFEVGQCPRPIP